MRFTGSFPKIIAALVLVLPACDYNYNHVECEQNSDCPIVAEKQLFCTADHLCVAGTPKAQLCSEIYPPNPAPDAIPIGVFTEEKNVPNPQNEVLLGQSIKLGVKEVNAVLATAGKQLVLHICDVAQNLVTDDYLTQDTRKAMDILLRERGVVAIVGPGRSSAVLAVADRAAADQVPLVSPSASSPAISSLPHPGFVFRTYPTAALSARALATLVPREQSLGLAYVDEPFGTSYQNEFVSAWVDPQIRNMPTLTVSFPSLNQEKMAIEMDKLIQARPASLVLLAQQWDMPLLTRLLERLDDATQIYMSGGGRTGAMLDLIGGVRAAHLQRIQGIAGSPPTDSPAYASFKSKFMGEYGVDPTQYLFTLYTYDAFYAIAIAVGSIPGRPTGAQVAEALSRITTTSPNQDVVGQGAYLRAIQTLQQGTLALQGTSGPIGFARNGDRESALFEKWRIDLSNRVFISTPLP